MGIGDRRLDQFQKTSKTSKTIYNLEFSNGEINSAGKIISDNNVNSMEAGFLNY